MAPPLFDNQAEVKMTASEHCWRCNTQHLSMHLRRCFCSNKGVGQSGVVVSHVITGHLDPLQHPTEVGEKCCPPKRSSVSAMLESKWNEYMRPLLNSMEEVSCGDHHPECDCDEWTPTVSAPSLSITPGQEMMELTQIQDGIG